MSFFKDISFLFKAKAVVKSLLATKSTESAAFYAGLGVTLLGHLAPAAYESVNTFLTAHGMTLEQVTGTLITVAAARLFKSNGGAVWAKKD